MLYQTRRKQHFPCDLIDGESCSVGIGVGIGVGISVGIGVGIMCRPHITLLTSHY